ncbi:hypothetical protein F1B92_01725 [Campylobacter sp. FMV-PI01]|uniref:Exporting protein n=1 Tax=Campylobacter portucalensis TaxID=2608384 RepID=A0A6L5WJA7_9BACT|nr:hypothetical protein [Campylobacter portucalensis]MSN95923.1 hypothetical protein [Campylobacter portucalensis]
MFFQKKLIFIGLFLALNLFAQDKNLDHNKTDINSTKNEIFSDFFESNKTKHIKPVKIPTH